MTHPSHHRPRHHIRALSANLAPPSNHHNHLRTPSPSPSPASAPSSPVRARSPLARPAITRTVTPDSHTLNDSFHLELLHPIHINTTPEPSRQDDEEPLTPNFSASFPSMDRSTLRNSQLSSSPRRSMHLLERPVNAIHRVWRGTFSPQRSRVAEAVELDARRLSSRKLVDDDEDDPRLGGAKVPPPPAMAYLQDPSLYRESDSLGDHRETALKFDHARFSRVTLRFRDQRVEQDFGVYLWGRSARRWRLFVAAAGCVMVALQLSLLVAKAADHAATNAMDWIGLAIALVIPSLALAVSAPPSSARRSARLEMTRWFHHVSLLFLLLIGPVLTCTRYIYFQPNAAPEGETGPADPSPTLLSPAVTAPLYVVLLISAVFFLRLRFVHTLVAALVAAPTWYAVVLATEISLHHGLAQHAVPSLALFLACVVACCVAYDLELTLRTQYLSDSRFLAITRNLQSQLEGLERSLLAASGAGDVTPADLDSPLEKALVAVRSLLLDPTLRREHRAALDLVMACLSSPNLLTPDLDRQVTRGEVAMDREVEAWLFNEVARRKRMTVEGAQAAHAAAPSLVGGLRALSEASDDEDEDGEAAPGSVVAAAATLAPAAEPADLPHGLPAAASAVLSRRRGSTIAALPTVTAYTSSLVPSLLYTPQTVPLLARVGEFNFPIFEFAREAGGRPLLVLAHHLCVQTGLVGRLGLDADKFVACVATIEDGYHGDLAFHNSLHAADVLHCINYLSNLPTINRIFSDVETLSILLAAAVHDLDHPGVNNGFLIASRDRRALLYNDKSVLENHHCASAFEIMSRRGCDFLSGLDRAGYKAVRETVIDMVLATDLAQHFSLLSMFKKKVLTADTFDPLGTREDRTLLMQMLMKCADVSNPTKAWPEYNEWIQRIIEEWFAQGDLEKSLGLPVSPFCNRDGPTLANPAPSQLSFIDYIVAPLFDAFGAWTDLGEVKLGLDASRARWAAAVAADKAREEEAAAAAAAAKKQREDDDDAYAPPPPTWRPRRNRSSPQLPGLVTSLSAPPTPSPPPASAHPLRGAMTPLTSAIASSAFRAPHRERLKEESAGEAPRRWRRSSGPAGWLSLGGEDASLGGRPV